MHVLKKYTNLPLLMFGENVEPHCSKLELKLFSWQIFHSSKEESMLATRENVLMPIINVRILFSISVYNQQ